MDIGEPFYLGAVSRYGAVRIQPAVSSPMEGVPVDADDDEGVREQRVRELEVLDVRVLCPRHGCRERRRSLGGAAL